MDKKWEVLEVEEVFKNKFMVMKRERCRMPDGREVPDYYVMDYMDWAHVVPVTEDGQLLMLKQYRHAARKVCIEFPGGTLDSRKEDPKAAAMRELQEETGYVPEDIRMVAKHHPNPASQGNYLYTFVALGCRKEAEQNLDPTEDIEVFKAPVPEVLKMAFNGELEHSLMLSSFFHALPVLGYNLV